MLIDNKIDCAATGIKSVYDFILKYTGKGVRIGGLDIVTGFCSLVGLDVLGKEFDEDNRYRLVLSRLTDGQDSPFRSIDILHNDSGIASAFAVSFVARRVIDFLKRDKVEIRFVAETFCHANAYLYQDEADDTHECVSRTKMDIANIVDAILATKKSDSSADTLALEAEIVEKVFDFYGLTLEEREIVKGGVK